MRIPAICKGLIHKNAVHLVPTLCVGTRFRDALRRFGAAERPIVRYDAERRNEEKANRKGRAPESAWRP